MKLNLIALLATLLFTFSAQATKVGYVDLQKAILSTTAGKQARKQIEAEAKKRKKQIDQKRADFEKMQKDFEKKSLALSNNSKAKKYTELQREGAKLQELFMTSQRELRKKEISLQQPILKTVQKVIPKIAKQDKYDMIIEKSENTVLWASKSVDITDQVIKEFEKAHKK